MIGHLTSTTRLPPDGVYRAGAARELRVDAELVVEIGPKGEPVQFGTALELVDVARPPDDFESIVAGNLWHRAFAFGALRAEPPPEMVTARVLIDGEVAGSAERQVDAADAVRIVTGLLAEVGERLEPGDRIIAGALVQVPVASGNEVVVELSELGRVEVRIG